MPAGGTRALYVEKYGEEQGNKLYDLVAETEANYDPTKVNFAPQTGQTADGGYDNLLSIANLADEGLPEPPQVSPLFTPYTSFDYMGQARGITPYDTAQRWQEVAFHTNRKPYDFDWTPYNEEQSQIAFGQNVGSITAGLQGVQDLGIPMDDWAAPSGGLNDKFYTQAEMWTFGSGMTVEWQDMFEAAQTQYNEQMDYITEYQKSSSLSIERLLNNQVWLAMMDERSKTGLGLPEEMKQVIAYGLNRDISEEQLNAELSLFAKYIQERPELLETKEGRAEATWALLIQNSQDALQHGLETSNAPPQAAPGIKDMASGLWGAWNGIVDILPEERLGIDVGGGIASGLGTVAGGVFGADYVSGIFNGIAKPLGWMDEQFVMPVRRGISESFATQNFFGMSFGLDQKDPYRVYLTPGQNMAISMGHDPGTDWFKNISGSFDALSYFVLDPLTYVAPMAKGNALRRAKAADVALIGTRMGRFKQVAKAIVPIYGRSTYTGWKGMKGPLTRAYYWATASGIDDLAQGRRAQKMFKTVHAMLQETNGVGRLLRQYSEFQEAPKLVSAWEAAVKKGRGVDEIQNIFVESVKGGFSQGSGSAIRNLRAAHADEATKVNTHVRAGLESGEIGALDVGGLQLGDDVFYDAGHGLVDNGDGTFRGTMLGGEEGREVYVFSNGNTRSINAAELSGLPGRMPAPLRRFADRAQRFNKQRNIAAEAPITAEERAAQFALEEAEYAAKRPALTGEVTNDTVVYMSLEELEPYLDSNVPIRGILDEEAAYQDTLLDGTGMWEGQGIKDVGIKTPLVIDWRSGNNPILVDGHHRYAAAVAEGIDEVPVRVSGNRANEWDEAIDVIGTDRAESLGIANRGPAPTLAAPVAGTKGYSYQALIRELWNSFTPSQKKQMEDYLAANGYHGIKAGGIHILSETGKQALVKTTDVGTGNLSKVAAKAGDGYHTSLDALRSAEIQPDILDWVLDLPKPKGTGTVQRLIVGPLAERLGQRLDPYQMQRLRRRQARFTRLNDKVFPKDINAHDVGEATREISQIGHRLGLDPKVIDGYVDKLRKSPRHKRFNTIKDIRHDMLDQIGDYTYREGLVGGFIVDEKEAKYGGYSMGESSSRDGVHVEIAYEETQKAARVPMFQDSFYTHLARLDLARSAKPIPFKNGFLKGTKSRRHDLVERFRAQIKSKGVDLGDFDDNDVYNMAFATITGDESNWGLGKISTTARNLANKHKAVHGEFSLMALALMPGRWLMKVVGIEEPIRASIYGIPAGLANPVAAVQGMFHSHLLRAAQKNAELIPDAIRRTRDVFNEIVDDAVARTDNAVQLIDELVLEFGDEILDFLPEGALDKAAATRAADNVADKVASLRDMTPDEFYEYTYRKRLERIYTEAGTIPLTDEMVEHIDEVWGAHDWLEETHYPHTPQDVAGPDGTRVQGSIPVDQRDALDDRVEDFQQITEVRGGQSQGVLELTLDDNGMAVNFDLSVAEDAPASVFLALWKRATELHPTLADPQYLAQVADSGIHMTRQGARALQNVLKRLTDRPPRVPLTYQDARRASQQLLNRYFDDLNLDLAGRAGHTKDVRKAVRRLQRAENPPKWSRPGTYAMADLEDVGRAPDGSDIYAKSMMNEHIKGKVESAREYTQLGRTPSEQRKYVQAHVPDMIREARDPGMREAVQRQLHMLDNPNRVERIERVLTRTDFASIEDNIRRIYEARMPAGTARPSTSVLATWYYETFMPDVLDKKIGQFYRNADGSINAARRKEVLQGFLDYEINIDGTNKYMWKLKLGQENKSKATFGRWLQDQMDVQADLRHMPQRVVTAPVWEDGFKGGINDSFLDRVNRPLSKIVDKFGPKASEYVTREPGWRRIYGEYRREYEALGWDPKMADAAARNQATKQINAIMYDIDSMSNWRARFNQIMPFGAAMVEVTEVWFKNIPRDAIGGGGMAGWLVGSAALARRVERTLMGLESIGLIKRDEDGQFQVVLEDSEQIGTPLGNALSHGMNDLFNMPTNFARMVASIGPLADLNLGDDENPQMLRDMFPRSERITFGLGNPIASPLDTQNQGLFAINRLNLGFAPHLSYTLQGALNWSGIMGAKDTIEWEGGTLQELLSSQDLTLEQLLSDASNREEFIGLGWDLDEIGQNLPLFELGVNPDIPAHVRLEVPHTGFAQQLFGDYIFPFGAPSSPQEAVGEFVPGAMQWLARGLERQFNQVTDEEGREYGANETPFTDWWFGSQSVYSADSSMTQALMWDEATNGTLTKYRGLQQEATAIRVELLKDGQAAMIDAEGSDFSNPKWGPHPLNYDPDDPRWAKLGVLEGRIADVQHIVIERANNQASAFDFIKSMTMMFSPTSPRLMRKEQIEMGEFWASIEFGDALLRGRGPAAFAQWQQSVRPRKWDEMAGLALEFLKPDDTTGLITGDIAAAKRNLAASQPTLAAYLTPSKIYTERWIDTESPAEFMDAVGEGKIRWADPEVYLMRHFRQALSWQQGAEKEAFFEGVPLDKRGLYIMDNWDGDDGWQALNDKHKVERDYHLFLDENEFDGAYNKAIDDLRKDAEESEGKFTPEGVFGEQEQVWREAQIDRLKLTNQTLSLFIDDLDSYDLDPSDAKEMQGVLYSLKNLINAQLDLAQDLTRYGAYSPAENEVSLYFDTVYGPHIDNLAGLYSKAFAATDEYERSLAFDNVRRYSNSVWYSAPQIGNNVWPNPLKWQLDIKSPEELRLKGMRALGKKVEWLHQQDIEALKQFADKDIIEMRLPHDPQSWQIYHLYNRQRNEIERSRLSGLLTNKEARDMNDSLTEQFRETLIEEGRAEEVEWMDMTPIQRNYELGILPASLERVLGIANDYLKQVEAMGKSGDTQLWRTVHWPAIEYELQTNGFAGKDFAETIDIMYGEQITRDGARRFLLGIFNNE